MFSCLKTICATDNKRFHHLKAATNDPKMWNEQQGDSKVKENNTDGIWRNGEKSINVRMSRLNSSIIIQKRDITRK